MGRKLRQKNANEKTSLQPTQIHHHLLFFCLLLLPRWQMSNSLRLESSKRRRRLCFDTFKA